MAQAPRTHLEYGGLSPTPVCVKTHPPHVLDSAHIGPSLCEGDLFQV